MNNFNIKNWARPITERFRPNEIFGGKLCDFFYSFQRISNRRKHVYFKDLLKTSAMHKDTIHKVFSGDEKNGYEYNRMFCALYVLIPKQDFRDFLVSAIPVVMDILEHHAEGYLRLERIRALKRKKKKNLEYGEL